MPSDRPVSSAATPLPGPRKITRNAARCHGCGDLVESKHRHDFRECSCGAIFVDGGLAYIRRGWRTGATYDELSEYADA